MSEALDYTLSARMFAYALFNRIFAEEPTESLLEMLICEQTWESMSFMEEEDFFPHLREQADWLRDIGAESALADLIKDFTRLFLGPGKLPAPPWESVYLSGQDILYQVSTLRVRNAYREQGYMSVGYPRVADDHIAIETDFMRRLAERSIVSLAEGDRSTCLELLSSQKRFLNTHMLVWVSLFAERIRLQVKTCTFYPCIAESLSSYIVFDDRLLDEISVIV
ncbi:MAG: molecular chaperone TorD family protein [Coriobacteriales bacterium]|nr:molecular chaperone TorD family protein [Coriobacteriales bacterium]